VSRPLFFCLAALTGCRGFETPEPAQIRDLLAEVAPPEGPSLRLKVRLDLESAALSGAFWGVIAARTGPEPRVRAQFFPDVGGKVVDLVARPDRITGVFPMTAERLDIALPEEGRVHPLSLIGVTLLEHCAPLSEERVRGVRPGPEGLEYRLAGIAPGVTVILEPRKDRLVRTFEWKYGVRWTETCPAGGGASVTAPRFRLNLTVIEKERVPSWPDRVFEISRLLPAQDSGAPR
jgi:hypothetical protein